VKPSGGLNGGEENSHWGEKERRRWLSGISDVQGGSSPKTARDSNEFSAKVA